MLLLARESRQMTQLDLSKACGFSQGKISKIEQGFTQPSEDDVRTFSRLLNYPVTFFQVEYEPHGFPPYHFRKRKKLNRQTLAYIKATINILRFQIAKLVESVELETDKKIPSYDLENFNGDVAEVARLVREYWGVPDGPVPDMVRLIEAAGGVVIYCDLKTRDLDALSHRVEGLPPLIFVNSNLSGDRARFTLAHEIGHLILHTIPDDDGVMEEQADKFAADLLMPGPQIRPQLVNLSMEKLARLKAFWKVSMQALLKRATQLRTITKWQAEYLWRQIARSGYRLREPVNIQQEKASVLARLVASHMSELGLSAAVLAAMLHVRLSEFLEFYLGENLDLKVVSAA
jgi:Zn-dependent peptidase ImmA (M78 family)/DNA-binding XRE family transcriptional regulator